MSMKSGWSRGLRAIALFEAAKAVLILIAGCGLLFLVNRDVGTVADHLVRKLHLNPASKYPQIFVQAAKHLTDINLWMLAALVLCDAVLRGVVAYGLWLDRYWAKWLGLSAAGIYMPLEVYEIWIHPTSLKVATFVINTAIVVFLGFAIRSERRSASEGSAN